MPDKPSGPVTPQPAPFAREATDLAAAPPSKSTVLPISDHSVSTEDGDAKKSGRHRDKSTARKLTFSTIAGLIKGLAWPVVVAWGLLRFGPLVEKLATTFDGRLATSNTTVKVGELSFIVESNAIKRGDPQLAAQVKGLSDNALELLLSDSDSWGIGESQDRKKIYFPSSRDAWTELVQHGLAQYTGSPIPQLVDSMHCQLARNECSRDTPFTPAELDTLSAIEWRRTEAGQKAHTLLIDSVVRALAEGEARDAGAPK